MKKLIIISLIACMGCLKEENTDLGLPDTFVKYFNGGFNDEAQDIKITNDGGYLMLATTTVRVNEVTAPYYKIKIIKTDRYGNQVWQKIYPPYGPVAASGEVRIDSVSFRGRSLAIIRDAAGLETGYVVVGDSIHARANAQSHLLIMLTDINGDSVKAKTLKPSFAVQGKGVVVNPNGSYTVLGAASNPASTKNMYLAEVKDTLNTLALKWQRTHGAGESQLANRLYRDNSNAYYWAGTVIKQGPSEIRFLKTPGDSENTLFDLEIGEPGFSETANDLCTYGFGFAVTGTSNQNGDDDILFVRLAEDGRELESSVYGFPNQSEIGLAVCQARDGGLVLLGSVNTHIPDGSTTQIGRGGRDYYLIKINAFGDEEWSRVFGSKNDDIGAKVLTNADGSYVIFGTTLWGGLRTLSLIKTDTKGNIE